VNVLDYLIVLAALAYAVGGYRNGAVIGAFSLVGFFGGALLGAQLAQPLGRSLADGQAQVPVAIVCVLMAAMLGQLIAVFIGGHLRSRLVWRSAQRVDAAIGSALGICAVLLVAWMVAVPLASSPYPSLNTAMRGSSIIRKVDGVMPENVRTLYSELQRFIDRSGFPPVFGPLQSPRITDVKDPNPALASSAIVTKVHPSVLKVYSEAFSCSRGMEGSGFVYAPHHMLTNAHVVAGADKVRVVAPSGDQVDATVVVFDSSRDVAVLYVPDLDSPALPFVSQPASTNDEAIVLGYPGDGGYTARSATVGDLQKVSGRDIYGTKRVEREIYSVKSIVRSGNSGGPLITPAGAVLGIVFATSYDSPDTGFVLTDGEVMGDADQGRGATEAVDTAKCTD